MDQSNQRDQDEKRRLLPNIGDTYSATIAGHSATMTGLTTAKIHMRKKAKTRPTSHRKYHEKTSSYGERTKQKSKVSTSPERPTSGPFGDLCQSLDTQTDSDNLIHQAGKLDKKTRAEKMLSTSSENLPPWRPAGLAIGKSYPRQLVFDTTKPQMYRRRSGNPFHGLSPIPPIKQKATRKDRLNSGKLKHTNKHRHQGCLETHDNWRSDFDIKPTRLGSEKEPYLQSARKVVKVHPRIARNKLLDSDPDGLLSSCHRSLKAANESSSDFKTKGTEESQENPIDETDVVDDHIDTMCETEQGGTSSNSCPCWKSCVKPGASSNVRWVTFKDYLDHQQSDFRQADQNRNGLSGPRHHQHDQDNETDNNQHDPQSNTSNSNHKSTVAFCKAEDRVPRCKIQNDCEKYINTANGITEAERKCDEIEQHKTSVDVEPMSSDVTSTKEQTIAEEHCGCDNETFENTAPEEINPDATSSLIVGLDENTVECSAIDLSETVLSNLEGEELTTDSDTADVEGGILLHDESNDTKTATDVEDTEVSNSSLHNSFTNGDELRESNTTTPDEIVLHTTEQHGVCVEEQDDLENLLQYDENSIKNDSETDVMDQCKTHTENKEGINLPETRTVVEQSLSGTVDGRSPPTFQETRPNDDLTNCLSLESVQTAVSLVNTDSAILATQNHVTDGLADVSDGKKELSTEAQNKNRQCEDTNCVDIASTDIEGVKTESKLEEKINSAEDQTQNIHRHRDDDEEQKGLCRINDSQSPNVENVSSKESTTDKTSPGSRESSPSGQYFSRDIPMQGDEPAFHSQKSPSEDLTSSSRLNNQESFMRDAQKLESPNHTEDSTLDRKGTPNLQISTPPQKLSHMNVTVETIKQNRIVHFSEEGEENSSKRPESVAGPVVTDVEKNPMPPCWSTFDFTVQRPNTAPEKSSDISQLYQCMQPENKIPSNPDHPTVPLVQPSIVTDDASPLMAWSDYSATFPPATGDTQFDKAFEGINVINLYANLVARYSFRSQNRIREALEQMPPDDNLHRRATMCTPAKKCATEVQKFRQALQDLFLRYFRIEQAQDELCWFVRNMSRTGLQRVNEVIDADVSEVQVLQAIEEEVAVAARCPNREITSGAPELPTNNTDRVKFDKEANNVDDGHDQKNEDKRDDIDTSILCDRDMVNCDFHEANDSGQLDSLNALPSTSTLCNVPSVTTPLSATPGIKETCNVSSAEDTSVRPKSGENDIVNE